MRAVLLSISIVSCTPARSPGDEPVKPPPATTVATTTAIDAAVATDATLQRLPHDGPPPTVRFEGAITDLDFGCWADNDCGIEVDDIWVWMPGGMRDDPPPQGKVIGFSIGGGPADEVRRKLLGKRVEVYAAQMPIWDSSGHIRAFDPKKLTLEGDAAFYVRAK